MTNRLKVAVLRIDGKLVRNLNGERVVLKRDYTTPNGKLFFPAGTEVHLAGKLRFGELSVNLVDPAKNTFMSYPMSMEQIGAEFVKYIHV